MPPVYLIFDTLNCCGWKTLLDAIAAQGRYVVLNLSLCTMNGTEFNPDSAYSTGKDKIVEITLPGAAESIADGADSNATFKNFTNLKFAAGANVTGIGEYAFQNCDSLTSVSFPEAAGIGAFAFDSIENLTSASFPKATTIGAFAFRYCTNLTSVSFSKAADITDNPFLCCASLSSFTLTGSSGALSVLDGGKALVRNNTELIDYPSASGTVTLNTITSIGDYAFIICRNLTTLHIPNVTSIGYSVFAMSNSLSTITLGMQAPTLGNNLFGTSQNITVRVPAGATGYDEAWRSGLLGYVNRDKVSIVEQ